MTMPTLARELPRHEERYVRSWQVIDQLVNFGMKEDAQELPAFADLQPEAVQTLLTPNGRAELALWIGLGGLALLAVLFACMMLVRRKYQLAPKR